MNTTHIEESILQDIATSKMNIPATVMEHYKSCITCRQTVKKYVFMLEQLKNEQRPVLSVRATHMILAGLPPAQKNTKSYGVLLMVCTSILICFSILCYLLKQFQKELPIMASTGALLTFAVIIVNEVIDHVTKYQRKIAVFESHINIAHSNS